MPSFQRGGSAGGRRGGGGGGHQHQYQEQRNTSNGKITKININRSNLDLF